MTPQEENVRIQQQVNEELRAYMEAQRAATKETEKSAEIEAKVAGLTATALQVMEKLYNAQLKYTIAMAEGKQGAAQFNDSIDAMTEATQIAAVALSLLVPGGPLIKGVVAGLTFLATQAMKTAAELQKAANLQADATYKAFSAFSKAGATGADGLTGFFNDVSRMRLNVRELDQLAGAMANSAQEMAGMGGTVFKAREQFADLNQGLRKAELGFLRLGLSNAETAEASLGFMKMQNTLTLGQQKDYGKLSGAAKKYIEEQEALTRATGFTRKQQEAAQEKFMSQERFGAKLAQLEREGTEESRAMAKRLVSDMAKAAAVSDQFGQAFADSVTQMYTSEASVKGLTSTQGTLGEYLNDVLENRIKTEEESNAGFQKIFKAMDETQEMFGGSQLAGATEGFLFDMKTFQTAQIRAKNGFDVQMKDSKTEVDKLMGTISGVDEQLTRFTKDVLKKQIDQMVKEQAALNGKFSTEVAGPTGWVDMMISSMKTLTKWILSVVEVLKPLSEGLGKFFFGALNSVGKLLTGDFTGVIHDLGGATKSFTDGLIETNRLFGEAIWNAMKTFGQGLMKSIQEITGALGPVFENVGKVMSGFGDSVKNGLAKFADALVDVVRDIFKKLTALIPNFGTAIEYAQTGADAVKTAGDSVVNFVSSVFGGATAPAGGSGTTTPVSAPASTPAPASVKPTAAPAPQGGKPSAAPAPASVKPSAAPAPASVKPSAAAGGNPPASSTAGGKPPADKPVAQNSTTDGIVQMGDSVRIGDKIHKGGTPSWRTNNPGNGSYDGITRQYGAIGTWKNPNGDKQQRGKGIAIFPNLEDGEKYKMAQWLRPMYIKKTIDEGAQQWAEAIGEYGPGSPYAKSLAKAAGATLDTVVGTLSESQLKSMTRKQTELEGFREGQVVQAEKGGVFDGPKSGYAATLHGMEAVIPLKDGAVPVSMSQEFNMTATNLGELVNIMKNNVDMQATMLAVLDEIRRVQTTTADNTGKMVAYASN